MSREPDKLNNHRLHALCPYFAMFPPEFARSVLLRTTEPGDLVLDPFSGRGTTILEALINNRNGIACDINPVAAIISAAKARPPKLDWVLDRIGVLESNYKAARRTLLESEAKSLPEFFRYAFHPETLLQILFLRNALSWARSNTAVFIRALCLGHLHGECNRSPNYFSNQMAHTIAMKPQYAMRYWKTHDLIAPERNVFDILFKKASYRLDAKIADGKGVVKRIDVRKVACAFQKYSGQVAAVITSPPYLDVTNFEEDQWLRLWFVGGQPRPTYGLISKDDRHDSSARYFEFLRQAWAGVAPLIRRKAVVTCRIAANKITPNELATRLIQSFGAVWPKGGLIGPPTQTALNNRQTNTFLPGTTGCIREYDFSFATA
jgi:hypothetical protein